jgi:formylglycine-generating enzyme required for sulfatase activity
MKKENSTETAKVWGGIDFVRIPKGCFIMESDANNELAWEDERPQHTLEITYDYWIGRFPVCNAQFGEFVRSTSFETRAEKEGWCWLTRIHMKNKLIVWIKHHQVVAFFILAFLITWPLSCC